jgi:hypothetical protein
VVVPDHREGKACVRRLQVGVEFVQRVAQAVGAQIHRLFGEAHRQRRALAARAVETVLVGVVAQVQHEVEVELQHVAVGRVVAARPVLAGGEGEAQAIVLVVPLRRGAEVADAAFFAAHMELVEVVGAGAQALDFDMHRMREPGHGSRNAVGDDVPHARVDRDAPAHGNVIVAESGWFGRLRRQARPQHGTVGLRIARRHTERERIPALTRRGAQLVPRRQRQRQGAGDAAPRGVEKTPAFAVGGLRLAVVHGGLLARGGLCLQTQGSQAR